MQTSLSPSVCRAFLGCQVEKAVDELNLTKKIISCHPSTLPLPDHVDFFTDQPTAIFSSERDLGVMLPAIPGGVRSSMLSATFERNSSPTTAAGRICTGRTSKHCGSAFW